MRQAGLWTCTVVFAWGCANPNTYATPRSLPQGAATFVVAPEVSAFGGERRGSSDFGRVVPVPPTVGIRYGLSDEVDLGARLVNLTAPSADVKWNFLRSPAFDAAVAPGLQLYVVPGVGESDVSENVSEDMPVVIVHAPVLLGFNVAPAVSIIPSVGLSYAFAKAPPAAASDIELSQVLTGPFGRLGLALDLRLGERFALHPELTVLRGFAESEGFLVMTGGLGLVFGGLPEYDNP